ncbi:hypothetical protein CERZMDRAFT_115217 [Cercospora zeae-maydis SCOH1-5]|uniref:Potassium channel domain-containing protein n=1 Tax=Cercospora zeae-maydis SCOH1-5 TaxID=717836 RepID=A0A6A6F072_9PEZI|nr:hypothetical protein CERZMDRAFT_115217 [Cercospora zeae-maydis SCOH1-5]
MSVVEPAVRESIEEAARDAEAYPSGRPLSEKEEEASAPTRWWFASTACPLLAATFGPIANGFSICALVCPWREVLPPKVPEGYGHQVPDPPWLMAVNAASLVSALIGNVALLLNMAQRMEFSTAQPITIGGFILAGMLLIGDVIALTSSPAYFLSDPVARQSGNHALTAAFYYAVIAAVIYIVIGLLMCITVYGAHRQYYSKDFQLTNAQRMLMLQTMMFVAYILLAAWVFSSLENWRYLDAVYWADVTVLTIGLGDYKPVTKIGRGLLFPYAVGGILLVGLIVGSIRKLVLEHGELKIAARITEKRRKNALHEIDHNRGTLKISWFAKADYYVTSSMSPAQRREEEFNVMRKVQNAADRERRYFSLSTSMTFASVLWLVGAVVFMVTEKEQDLTYYQSVYFSFVSLMTIGYGDIVPASNCGKAFYVIWSLLAIPTLTILISGLGDTFTKMFTGSTSLASALYSRPREVKQSAQDKARRAANKVSNIGKKKREVPLSAEEHRLNTLHTMVERLESHVEEEELKALKEAESKGDDIDRDIHFYHFVLARELTRVQKDLLADSPVQYSWGEWEFFLLLIGHGSMDENDISDDQQTTAHPPRGQNDDSSTTTTKDRPVMDGLVDRDTQRRTKWNTAPTKRGLVKRRQTADPIGNWSWLDEKSPLMSVKSESQWLADKLSATLVRELDRSRKGEQKSPPIGMRHLRGNVTG